MVTAKSTARKASSVHLPPAEGQLTSAGHLGAHPAHGGMFLGCVTLKEALLSF